MTLSLDGKELPAPKDRSGDAFITPPVPDHIRETANALSWGFTWAQSAEGYAFWQDVQNRLSAIAEGE